MLYPFEPCVRRGFDDALWILVALLALLIVGCCIEVVNGRAVFGLARHFEDCVRVEVARMVR